jgi:hypothetical protein
MKIFLVVMLIIGFGIAIYGGLYAKKELPIKEEAFSWKNVMIAIVVYIVTMVIATMAFLSLQSGTPNCSDDATKQLVKEIAFKEFTKQGMPQMTFSLSHIRVSSYDEKIDKYECASDLTVIDSNSKKLSESSIIYTSQMTEDGENFYVQVFGL